MDEIVKQAMAKWPNVPHCYSWLGMDARGNWYMRDDRTQAMGSFASGLAGAKGSMLKHEKLIDFIERNYSVDAQGCWYFQNGPQRVYISLAATPWIARITPSEKGLQIMTQCNSPIEPSLALSDESGNIYIVGLIHQTIYQDQDQFEEIFCESVALLHDHDLDQFSELAKLTEEACSFGGSWNWHGKQLLLEPIYSEELANRFRFITQPSL